MSIQRIQHQINDVRNTLVQNYQSIEMRQQNLKDLTVAAETLEESTKVFKQTSEDNKLRLYWINNFRKILFVFILISIIVGSLLIIGFIIFKY